MRFLIPTTLALAAMLAPPAYAQVPVVSGGAPGWAADETRQLQQALKLVPQDAGRQTAASVPGALQSQIEITPPQPGSTMQVERDWDYPYSGAAQDNRELLALQRQQLHKQIQILDALLRLEAAQNSKRP